MDRVIGTCTLALSLIALSSGMALSQTSSDATAAATTATASHVAYVYVGTTNGVYLYNAASNGSLSLVAGSPFPIAGNAIGSNGNYFLSLGTHYLHSYPVASNGAIKGQVAQINTALYTGAVCSNGGIPTTDGGTIDRTGTEVYIQFQFLGSYDEGCDALQSYKIDTTGAFTFGGGVEFGGEKNQALGGPLVISGNNGHAYAFPKYYCDNFVHAFYRDRFGAMNDATPTTMTFPPAGGEWFPIVMASDNQNLATSHMAVALHESTEVCTSGLASLAPYTNDYNGSLLYDGALLRPAVNPTSMTINPQGNLLAVGGNASFTGSSGGTQTPGLDIFHFNGANPITSYSGPLITTPINEIKWDNNNHLYAVSNSTHKLYAYTITSSGITAVPGSPYTIASTPNALVVVPSAAVCSVPASDGVHICSPASGSTVSSPVLVTAASTVPGTIARMELWVDGVKKYTATSSRQLNTSITLAAGSHRFAVLAINTAGQKWESAINATVK